MCHLEVRLFHWKSLSYKPYLHLKYKISKLVMSSLHWHGLEWPTSTPLHHITVIHAILMFKYDLYPGPSYHGEDWWRVVCPLLFCPLQGGARVLVRPSITSPICHSLSMLIIGSSLPSCAHSSQPLCPTMARLLIRNKFTQAPGQVCSTLHTGKLWDQTIHQWQETRIVHCGKYTFHLSFAGKFYLLLFD